MMKKLLNSTKENIRSIIQYASPSCYGALHRYRTQRAQQQADREYWMPRIQEVLDCPDNERIFRQPNAGRIQNSFQVMHNGLLVKVDGYYGTGMTELLKANRGCHEPQEEFVFQDVVRRMPKSARMLECGSYWGFYSMWFVRENPSGTAWLIEPETENIAVGKENFQANRLNGHFTQAFVGDRSSVLTGNASGSIPQVCIDDFLQSHGIESLDILHADIQGAELEMLNGAINTLTRERVDYIFISTHGVELHAGCVKFLSECKYRIEVSVDMADTCSMDGLIVAVRGSLDSPALPQPSLKSKYLVRMS